MDTENPGDGPPNKKLAELSDREFQIILEQPSRPGFGACEIQRRFIEAIKAGNTAGSEALKAIRRSANGSAGALLAFIGHLASISAPQATILSLRTALAAFVVGRFTAVFASGITYLSSSCTSFSLGAEFVAENEDEPEEIRRRAKKKERAWRVAWWITNSLAIILGGIALGSFCF